MVNSFEIKSIRLNALAILVNSLDIQEIESDIKSYLNKADDLNSFLFILDLSLYSYAQIHSFSDIINVFKKSNFKIIAIQHFDENVAKLAKQANLFFQLGIKTNQHKNINDENTNYSASLSQKNEDSAKQTVIIDRPIRSGQQIYAQNSDLIITSSVGEGAEILADGNIHVYSSVRGRVFAGVTGNFNARIFIFSMQAQLVCIAGIYRIFDQKLPNTLFKKSVEISLKENRLSITAINQ